MEILVTGGTGFIGSHTVVELIQKGHNVTILDNLYNSSIDVLDKIQTITNVKPKFYQVDICDLEGLDKVFSTNKFDAVIHFAGLKAVGESVRKPIEYYDNNICGSLNLYRTMVKYNVNNLIFSSSATVYGNPQSLPITEDFPIGNTTNPYGTTKVQNEQILQDITVAFPELSVILLRYFNPIGSHKSGLIGEKPNGIPNNLMPYITQVADHKLEQLSIYGSDYDTIDGTGVRDYIHVVDLAIGHVLAIEYAIKHKGCETFNLGTGHGYSVLEIVNAFEKANGIKIPYKLVDRRSGDIASCYADTNKAYEKLGFKTKFEIEEMCKDSWNFQQNLK